MDCTPEQAAEGMAIVRVLAAVLERLVSANKSSSADTSSPNCEITKFHALKAPGIGILQYLERIHKYASCSTECFILALIYIDRLIQRNSFILSELNVHRVVITAVLLAAKFFDDAYYNNAYYAKVGGVHVSEMNSLEVDFLFRINFSLHVSPEVFHKYNAELISHAGADVPLLLLQNNTQIQQEIDDTSNTLLQVVDQQPKSSLSLQVNLRGSARKESPTFHPTKTRTHQTSSRRITPSPPLGHSRTSFSTQPMQPRTNKIFTSSGGAHQPIKQVQPVYHQTNVTTEQDHHMNDNVSQNEYNNQQRNVSIPTTISHHPFTSISTINSYFHHGNHTSTANFISTSPQLAVRP